MEQEHKSLKELIAERVDAKGLNFEKILQATEIPRHYLEAIFRGDWNRLPAAPYVRGYLKKLASVLENDPGEFWSAYQSENDAQASGPMDRLPENRFAIKNFSQKWIWLSVLALVLVVYVGFNVDRFLGTPKLDIENPLGASLITYFPNFNFSGKADPDDKLFINGEEIFVDKSGQFQKNYNLQPGLNNFEITAKRFLGRETKIVKQIIYQNGEK